MEKKNYLKKLLPPNRNHVIENRSLLIKPISLSEVNERYVSWLNNPEVNQYLEVRHNRQTLNSTIDYINSLRAKKGCELFAILTKKKQIHIGNISITDYNPNNQCYVVFGMMIGDIRAQQLGLGGQALVLLMEYLFSNPLIIRIECGAIAENTRSWNTLESLGFKREGVFRNRSILSSGRVTNIYLYGLLREEWSLKRKMFGAILKDIKHNYV